MESQDATTQTSSLDTAEVASSTAIASHDDDSISAATAELAGADSIGGSASAAGAMC